MAWRASASSGQVREEHGDGGNSFVPENQDDQYGYFHKKATWTMDASSIPSNATVNSVSVSMIASTGGFAAMMLVIGPV